MVLIRGTKRLLAELDVTPIGSAGSDAPARALEEWYGNLIRIHRRKCLVFADVSTLFTFMIPGVVKNQYRDFRGLFLSHLRSALAVQGLSLPDETDRHPMVFGVTRDRRVLGSLNELVFHLTYYIAAAGGLARADLSDAIRLVNETPMTLIDDSPDRAIRRQLGVGPYD
jgi:hypothetical protein